MYGYKKPSLLGTKMANREYNAYGTASYEWARPSLGYNPGFRTSASDAYKHEPRLIPRKQA